jgi:hypothetical protein
MVKSRIVKYQGMLALIQSKNVLSSHLIYIRSKDQDLKTLILSVVLNGFETWSVSLKEEHGLSVSENRVLRRKFGPKREVDGSWRKFHNDELHSLYSSLNIIRVIKSRRIKWA